MPMESAAGYLLRLTGQFIENVFFVGIFYWPGWLVLRMVTLGRYPPSKEMPHNREFVSTIGLAAGLTAITVWISGVSP